MSVYKERISPITFVGDSIKRDEDLNEMLLLPYLNKVYQDVKSADRINPIKEKNINKYASSELFTMTEIIKDYIVNNISDVIKVAMIKIVESSSNTTKANKYVEDFLQSLNMDLKTLFYNTYDSTGISTIIRNSYNNTYIDVSYMGLCMNNAFGILFSKCVTLVDSFIQFYVKERMTNPSELFYENLFKMCYEANPKEDKIYSDKYNFCVVIMREISMQFVNELYLGLGILQNSVGNMIILSNKGDIDKESISEVHKFIEANPLNEELLIKNNKDEEEN